MPLPPFKSKALSDTPADQVIELLAKSLNLSAEGHTSYWVGYRSQATAALQSLDTYLLTIQGTTQ